MMKTHVDDDLLSSPEATCVSLSRCDRDLHGRFAPRTLCRENEESPYENEHEDDVLFASDME